MDAVLGWDYFPILIGNGLVRNLGGLWSILGVVYMGKTSNWFGNRSLSQLDLELELGFPNLYKRGCSLIAPEFPQPLELGAALGRGESC